LTSTHKKIVPIPTYFIIGSDLPESLQELIQNEGQICPNLIYLGKQGILKTSHGTTIAYLSGMYDEQKFYENPTSSNEVHFIKFLLYSFQKKFIHKVLNF